jgi:hypothetical protein
MELNPSFNGLPRRPPYMPFPKPSLSKNPLSHPPLCSSSRPLQEQLNTLFLVVPTNWVWQTR